MKKYSLKIFKIPRKSARNLAMAYSQEFGNSLDFRFLTVVQHCQCWTDSTLVRAVVLLVCSTSDTWPYQIRRMSVCVEPHCGVLSANKSNRWPIVSTQLCCWMRRCRNERHSRNELVCASPSPQHCGCSETLITGLDVLSHFLSLVNVPECLL